MTRPIPSVTGRVTVVVPVYGDWPSLRECVISLMEHANPETYDVLLVNDCGPEADEIEAGLRGMIHGKPGFRYERNPQNLGFVRTCNRAAYELDTSGNDILLLNSDTRVTAGALDELREVLALSEHHGVVCPRSNDATIATIPFFQAWVGEPRDAKRSHKVFSQLAPSLPRYYVAPVAIGFCFLVRRSIIDNHGLFDEVFGQGYNEENDFCLRVNALGYSALIANHAFVFHVGSTSFGDAQRAALEQKNSRVLRARYPFYLQAVTEFIENGYSAIDRFADVLVPRPEPRRAKALVDLLHLTPSHDGSARNAISFLEHVAALGDTAGVEVTVVAEDAAVSFFDLTRFGFRILPRGGVDEVFDIGIAVSPVTQLDQLMRLHRHCARWVVTYLDVIALRSWEFRCVTPSKPVVVRKAIELADQVVAISRTTWQDAVDLLPELELVPSERVRVIHQGAALPAASTPGPSADSPSSDGCVLVLGNRFKHKQVLPALAALQGLGIPVVALGDEAMAESHPWARILPAGQLRDEDLDVLYSGAEIIVTASAYEGFGLPLVEAAQRGKKVIAFDTAVAREVVEELQLPDVTFFSDFQTLADTVLGAMATPPTVNQSIRTIDEYNAELWDVVTDVLAAPVDLGRLERRGRDLRDIALVWEPAHRHSEALRRENAHILSSRSFTLARNLAATASPFRRVLKRFGR
nr:glycosyltransferase [Salinibacterium sp.]